MARHLTLHLDRRWALAADCGSCMGLCCVSLAFERGPAFTFSKPADVPHTRACTPSSARYARTL
ncbi:MAG TPA: hypothetical protein VNN80_10075 [Polyangiaceae bacterium]|nr:hypothetical protein [Polyangiaceae bacterium]